MNAASHAMAQAASTLASRLPYTIVLTVADALAQLQGPAGPDTRIALLRHVPTAEFREATAAFLDDWQRVAPSMAASTAATALLTAGHVLQASRQAQTMEMVWTGPAMPAATFRQTEQALLDVIQAATARLTVVSYAIYRIPRLQDALVAAAHRGVHLRVIVETPHPSAGQQAYDTLRALGARVASVATVYYWPHASRPRGDGGNTGLLHIKCVVADGSHLFLSSANLTDQALTINMELGLLMRGGRLPGQVERHLQQLIDQGIFVKIEEQTCM
jgi:phosphatidylserine/phosphatidylglycerophosphate/cardiolipin synthase-like enzyme